MFKLLRYFSIASLVAFLIVTVLLGFLYRRTAIEELVTQEENKNAAVTHAFVNSLRPQLIAYLDLTQGLTADELRIHPAFAALQQAIAAEAAGLPIAKIKIYNREGITIFSTEESQLGEDKQSNDGFITALGGGVVSDLTHRDSFNSFDGVLEDQDVLSTYFPVRLGQPVTATDGSGANTENDIQGVFELYSNVTPLLHRIDTTQRTLVGGVALILAILYCILFLVVRRADKIIRRQHMEQMEAEEELQMQQRTLATLRERERLARELHDNVGQVLGYLNTQTQTVSMLWAQGQTKEAQAHMQRLSEVVQEAHVDLRQQIRSLQIGSALTADFPGALKQYIGQYRKEYGIDVELINLEEWTACNLDENVGTQLLGIVQEALTNVRKHAQAEHVRVIFDCNDDQAQVTVSDDGRGFRREQISAREDLHFGLQMMHDRAQEIGAKVEVQSVAGQGTQVTVTVPLRQPVPAFEY